MAGESKDGAKELRGSIIVSSPGSSTSGGLGTSSGPGLGIGTSHGSVTSPGLGGAIALDTGLSLGCDQQSPALQGRNEVFAQCLDDVFRRDRTVKVEEQGDGGQATITRRPSGGQHPPAVASRRCRVILPERGVRIGAPERLQGRWGEAGAVQGGGERGQHRVVQLGDRRQRGWRRGRRRGGRQRGG